MANQQDDRRVQRSKQLLESALIALMAEKPFDKITIQEILDRANVGRTTFYAHFHSKEDLFLSSHDSLVSTMCRSFFSDDGTLRDEPSQAVVSLLELAQQNDDARFYLTWGSDTGEILQLLKERLAEKVAARLHDCFKEEESAIPFAVLAQQVATSMFSILNWWIDERMPYPTHEMASMLHRMNQVVLRDALGQ